MTRTSTTVALAACALLAANEGVAELSIVRDSPFIPPGWEPVSAEPAGVRGTAADFEFAGVYNIGEDWRFYLVDRTSGRSAWVRPGDGGDRIAVIRYEAASDSIVVEIDGITSTLALRRMPAQAAAVHAVAGKELPAPEQSPADAGSPALAHSTATETQPPLRRNQHGEDAAAITGDAHPAAPVPMPAVAMASAADREQSPVVVGGDPRILAARMYGIQ